MKIFFSGHSAGAYLSLLVSLDAKWLKAHDADAANVAAVIPLSSQMLTHFKIREERGIARTQPVIDELAPLHHARKVTPPMLLVTGDREKVLRGRYEENALFWRMMNECGNKRMELRELPNFVHGGMAKPAFPLLLDFVRKNTSEKN